MIQRDNGGYDVRLAPRDHAPVLSGARNHCKRCTQVCPHGVFAEGREHAILVSPKSCMECGACAGNCPALAITAESGVGCAWAMIGASGKGHECGLRLLRERRNLLPDTRDRQRQRSKIPEAAMKIGIISDGKFGDRAFEIIREKFPTEWITAPFPGSPVADDLELTLPECDLYISYVRHPDVALAIIEKQKPVVLGVRFGPGFLRQAKEINENIVASPTMCSLEDNTWVPEINEFAKVFGRPIFDMEVLDDGTIGGVRVLRGSPCGSTIAASAEMPGTQLSQEQIRHYGLRICHFCRAPRLGMTCDKEVAGWIHIRELLCDWHRFPCSHCSSKIIC